MFALKNALLDLSRIIEQPYFIDPSNQSYWSANCSVYLQVGCLKIETACGRENSYVLLFLSERQYLLPSYLFWARMIDHVWGACYPCESDSGASPTQGGNSQAAWSRDSEEGTGYRQALTCFEGAGGGVFNCDVRRLIPNFTLPEGKDFRCMPSYSVRSRLQHRWWPSRSMRRAIRPCWWLHISHLGIIVFVSVLRRIEKKPLCNPVHWHYPEWTTDISPVLNWSGKLHTGIPWKSSPSMPILFFGRPLGLPCIGL